MYRPAGFTTEFHFPKTPGGGEPSQGIQNGDQQDANLSRSVAFGVTYLFKN